MGSLASRDRLVSRLQKEGVDVNTASADQALEDASGLIRDLARQQFDFVPQETIILRGNEQVLTLPQRPLVVNAENPLTVVEIGDFGNLDVTCVEEQDYTRLGNQLTRGAPFAYTSRLQGWPRRRHGLGVWAPRVRVTYSHGYEVIPESIVATTIDVAQAMYTNPDGLRSWTTPEYAEVYATELLGAATVDSIKNRLSSLGRRQTAHSI
ncbi:MAG TPA: hypothetical protein VGL05_08025 [Kribbella sp.]